MRRYAKRLSSRHAAVKIKPGVERIVRGVGEQARTSLRPGIAIQTANAARRSVHEESDKSVEQQKSVILQKNKQREGNSRMVQGRFAGPRFDIVRGFEMHE